MHDGMGSMMAWMMGLGMLGWVLVIAVLVTILVVLIRLLSGPTPGTDPNRPCSSGCRNCLPPRGLKKLHEVARRVFHQYLRSTGSLNDVIAESDSGRAHSRDFSIEVIHDDLNTIPTARNRLAAVGHRSTCRAGFSA